MSKKREAPIEIGKSEFKKIGYELIDSIANFIDTIDEKPITNGESPQQLQKILGTSSLPEKGRPVAELLSNTTELLINHSFEKNTIHTYPLISS